MVYARHLKCCARKACGFESHLTHNQKATNLPFGKFIVLMNLQSVILIIFFRKECPMSAQKGLSTRERLTGLIGKADIRHLDPKIWPSFMARIRVMILRRRFFRTLAERFACHQGEPVLIVYRYASSEKKIGGKYLYLGRIAQVKQSAYFRKVLFPTSQYVVNRDWLTELKINCVKGNIPEMVFRRDIAWLYYTQFEGEYGMDIRVGVGDVERWILENKGRYPFLIPALADALPYTLRVNVGQNARLFAC